LLCLNFQKEARPTKKGDKLLYGKLYGLNFHKEARPTHTKK